MWREGGTVENHHHRVDSGIWWSVRVVGGEGDWEGTHPHHLYEQTVGRTGVIKAARMYEQTVEDAGVVEKH